MQGKSTNSDKASMHQAQVCGYNDSTEQYAKMKVIARVWLAFCIAGVLCAIPRRAKAEEFTFHAFGDAGWADTHIGQPIYKRGYLNAYNRFDPDKRLIGDLNYINWETGVGNTCSRFWSRLSPSTYAFLSPTKDLKDAINHGFNVIGLANNHSYDCLESSEGDGPLQTYNNVKIIEREVSSSRFIFSGIYKSFYEESRVKIVQSTGKSIPIIFASAYVGGNAIHCKNILCASELGELKSNFRNKKALRVLALHSWNKDSHAQLKQILKNWVEEGLVDLAIGSGPHVAENIEIVPTDHGRKILATSLGNFIHPSLAPQSNNSVLTTRWKYTQDQAMQLLAAENVQVSCDGEKCSRTKTTTLLK